MAPGPPHAIFREPRALFQDVLKGDIGSIAFVFGNACMGLARRTWRFAHVVLGIPTQPDFGSLNLASAVQLVAYDWRQALGGFREATEGDGPLRGRAADELYATARDDLFVSVDDMHDDAEARIAVRHQGTTGTTCTEARTLTRRREWYFGWPDIKPYFQEHVHTTSKVLIPGMGNDPLLPGSGRCGYERYHRL